MAVFQTVSVSKSTCFEMTPGDSGRGCRCSTLVAYSCISGLLEKQNNHTALIASYECFKKEDYEFSYIPPDFQSYMSMTSL